MRILILKDKPIPQKNCEQWQKEWSEFFTPLTLIKPIFHVEEYDFTDYPTEVDTDQTLRPGDSWLKTIGADISKRHGKYAFDHVILWIDLSNWKSDDGVRRIWGTNYSYVYGLFHVHYCRYDSKNMANTFGTIHHEMHHSYDALVKVETGVDVNPIVGVTHWDREITHGGKNPPWKYMRWKDNEESIRLIAPYLRQAYAARQQRHDEVVKGMRQMIIKLAQELLYLLRSKLNAKHGIQL